MESQHWETILVERHSSKDIKYIKPADKNSVVSVKNEKKTYTMNLFKPFLPEGYPTSVSEEYTEYQIWDSLQAFCSTIMTILAVQEVFRGVGVGDISATPLAATITWVLKDGCGHLGKILFAYKKGKYLDAYCKEWRLYADILNDVAMFMEMMFMEIYLPLFGSCATAVLCISTVVKSIVGVAGSATRVAMTQHHAVRGNLGDVSAKDSAQETAVNLVASFVALLILTVCRDSQVIFIIFMAMMVLHIVCNYNAVRSVCLRTLNESRYVEIIEEYLQHRIILSPELINKSEPVLFCQLGSKYHDKKVCGFHIKIGHSLSHVFPNSVEASFVRKIKAIYSEANYIVLPNTKAGIMYLFIKEQASVSDILCGYYHAVTLSHILRAISGNKPRPFTQIFKRIQLEEWEHFNSSKENYEPSYNLLTHVAMVASQDWGNVKKKLITAGWDVSKHQLIVDEWRVAEDESETESECSAYLEHSTGGLTSSPRMPVVRHRYSYDNRSLSPKRLLFEDD